MKPGTGLFPTLAVELIELIANDIEGEGLLDLRFTCRELQKKTFHCFARRFFTSIKTDLSDNNLQRIDTISQHEALRPYVQGLAFMLQNGVGRGLVWDRHPWGSLSAPMEIEAIRRLRDNLINKLTNCRSFFIFCRYPEGHPDMSRVTITDAVAVFFALILDAQLPVSSFHLIYANKFSRTLIMDMRRLPKLLYRQPEFKLVWSNLQKLSLEQYLTLDNFGFLLELILSAPNLRTLLLNLGSHDLACEFMHELAETAVFSQLKELALFRTLVRAPDLIKILGRLRENLSTLTFYHVSLAQDDSWTAVLQDLGRDFSTLNNISLYYLWANAPTKEVLSFPDLQKVPIMYESPGQRLHMLYADKPIKGPAVLGIEYSGSKVPQLLSLLQTTAIYK